LTSALKELICNGATAAGRYRTATVTQLCQHQLENHQCLLILFYCNVTGLIYTFQKSSVAINGTLSHKYANIYMR